ncbi:MAG: thioredoxin-like (seleno)protein SaoT [Bacillota bacterium]|jgi:hypothetical protein
MGKVLLEFINTCPCCDAYGSLLKELADKHPDKIDLRLYTAGVDMDYIPKYGMVTRGMLIINGRDKYEEGYFNKRIITEAVEKALSEME